MPAPHRRFALFSSAARSASARFAGIVAVLGMLASSNSAIAQQSQEVMRLGHPPNPPSFQPGTSTGPVIGKAWDPILIPAPLVNFTVIMINPLPGAAINVPTQYGTLLCAFPPIPALFLFGFAYQIYHIPIPNDPSLVGLEFCAQGMAEKAFGAPKLEFYNALDCKIGTF